MNHLLQATVDDAQNNAGSSMASRVMATASLFKWSSMNSKGVVPCGHDLTREPVEDVHGRSYSGLPGGRCHEGVAMSAIAVRGWWSNARTAW
eukprot:4846646-Amphidinium_carterae.1